MCGIAGLINVDSAEPIEESLLRRMLGTIRHRGPDQFGIYIDDQVGLGSARLSIIDPASGQQPITNEDETLWIVFNGEIFNHPDLRAELESRGHRFSTNTDTEVVLHLYEEEGPCCLRRLNGQFEIAIWDIKKRTLFLARDRVGVRPLFYTHVHGGLIFGSEVKAILADPRVQAELDPVALHQVFTSWSAMSPRTAFRGISELPPGHFMTIGARNPTPQPYWELQFKAEERSAGRSDADYVEELRELLVDAVRVRLRADVPVGAYLSGGLDSSTIAAIVRRFTSNQLDTFSIAFADARYDESEFQRRMAGFLGTTHQVVHVSDDDIGRVFPEVIWHTETTVLRTSPAPMYLLSRLAHRSGYKVVLTGEGADEFLAGYDIFKEAKIRRFWTRQPGSRLRPSLLRRLYPDVGQLSQTGPAFLEAFFRRGLTDTEVPTYSHAIRWRNTSRTLRFFSAELRDRLDGSPASDPVTWPTTGPPAGWLERAQYVDVSGFMSQYLLSAQGDRVAMAHSVEGRFPFLDHRVIDFCAKLPTRLKLRGLTDKYVLRRLAADWLPKEICRRGKRPYRAPIHRSLVSEGSRDYLGDILAPTALASAGYFSPAAVAELLDKIDRGTNISETDEMALAGIVSTQLWHEQFIARRPAPLPLRDEANVKLCGRTETTELS